MPPQLTVRQLWVLGYIREHPGQTIHEIADASPVDDVLTARWRERWGNDTVVRSLNYPQVQTVISRLLKVGKIRRLPEKRHPADPPYIHFVTEETDG